MKFNPIEGIKAMKFNFFLTAFCLVLLNQAVSSQTDPSVVFSPGVAAQVTGNPSQTGELNCKILINKTWPYPNSQVSPICDDATTSCIRYSLIQKSLKKAKGERYKELQEDLPTARKDVKMKLMGCVEAIEATINNSNSLTDIAGYGSSGYEVQ